MVRTLAWRGCVLAALLGGQPGAQEIAGELAAVQRLVDSQELTPALDRLLRAAAAVRTGPDRSAAAQALRALGTDLGDARDYAGMLRAFTAAQEIYSVLHKGADHADLDACLERRAAALLQLDRLDEALPLAEAAAAMADKVCPAGDDPLRAATLRTLSRCADEGGDAERADDLRRRWGRMSDGLVRTAIVALRNGDAAAAADRLLALRDVSPDLYQDLIVTKIGEAAGLLAQAGELARAQHAFAVAIAIKRRVHGNRADPIMAKVLNNAAHVWITAGRPERALPLLDETLQMRRQSDAGRAFRSVIVPLNNLANCLGCLGRNDLAHQHLEEAMALAERAASGSEQAPADVNNVWGLLSEPDLGPVIALTLHNLGSDALRDGDVARARGLFERALDGYRRIHGERADLDVAEAQRALAQCALAAGEAARGEAMQQQALTTARQAVGGRDHPCVAECLDALATCRLAQGNTAAALDDYRQALAMLQQLYGQCDHPAVARSHAHVGACLLREGETAQAMEHFTAACAGIERLRGGWSAASRIRQSMFDHLKDTGAFEYLQACCVALGKPENALQAAERSRSRGLLDLLAQQDLDPGLAAEQLFLAEGNQKALARLRQLGAELAAVDLEHDRLLHRLTALDDAAGTEERTALRRQLLAELDTSAQRRERLASEQAQWIAHAMPVGSVPAVADLRSSLQAGELLVEFTCTAEGSFVYALAREGPVAAHALPAAAAAVAAHLPDLLERCSHQQLRDQRGRDPAPSAVVQDATTSARRLFDALIPQPLWQRIAGARRVLLVPHRQLCRLPFELLVVQLEAGRPVHWLEAGPPIAYVPSGAVLHWLRRRAAAPARGDADPDLLVVGAPVDRSVAPPAAGATRNGDLERLARLPPLRGAREEVRAIGALWSTAGRRVRELAGEAATEAGAFAAAAKARVVHFACHGVAEEYAGQSLSTLVLSRPQQVHIGDDGLLQLDDLMHDWRNRLGGCDLVVLSACRTNIGRQYRDEAPQALPLGFLFAGARSVVSSLWAVDDDSTKELMVDFHRRLLAGKGDRLEAFVAARKQLREKQPDPYHWAPFLFIGIPD